MRLNLNTDYALRILIYLATEPDRIHGVAEVSRAFGMPHSTVMKMTSDLVRAGFIVSMRGRTGGVRLARTAAEINLGDVVTRMERSLVLTECGDCILQSRCVLKGIFRQAVEAFIGVLDNYSLADLVSNAPEIVPLFGKIDLRLDCDGQPVARGDLVLPNDPSPTE